MGRGLLTCGNGTSIFLWPFYDVPESIHLSYNWIVYYLKKKKKLKPLSRKAKDFEAACTGGLFLYNTHERCIFICLLAKDQPHHGEGFWEMRFLGAVKTNDSKSNRGSRLMTCVLLDPAFLVCCSLCSAFSVAISLYSACLLFQEISLSMSGFFVWVCLSVSLSLFLSVLQAVLSFLS